MSLWIYSENDFESEDETHNFGSRKTFITENTIEEWQTLCTFEKISQIVGRPSITLATSDSVMCVSIDNTVYVFEDHKCSQLLFSTAVDSEVDCCCLIEDANAVLIVLRKGYTCWFSLQGQLLFSRSIPVTTCSESATFVNIVMENKKQDRNGSFSVLIIGHFGSIHRIIWSRVNECNSGTEVTVHCVREEQINAKVSAATKLKDGTIALIGDMISMWSENRIDYCSLSEIEIKSFVKTQIWKNKYFVCLTYDGQLTVVCMKTLLCTAVWNTFLVEDFTLLEDKGNTLEENIVILVDNQSSSKEKTIVFSSFPDFKIISSVKISKKSWLVSLSRSILCIEGYTAIDNVEKLKISVLSRRNPEQRLDLLLKHHKYDEAELLAAHFGLDMQLIHKERALFFINEMPSNSDYTCFKQLICILDRIMEIDFIVSFCLSCDTLCLCDMKNLLCYGLKRLQACTEKECLLLGLNEKQYQMHTRFRTLETFLLINGNVTQNMKSILNLSWLKSCIAYLSKAKLGKARFIWLRHLKNGPVLSIDEMKLLFTSISSCMKQSDILAWLHLVIPYILCHAPDLMDILTQWAVSRVSMIREDDDQWQNAAINFIEEFQHLIIKIKESEKNQLFNSFVKQNEYLLSFLCVLQELKLLKDKYNINIPLELFLQNNKLELARNILMKVPYNDVERVLTEYIKVFVEKHDLQIDSVVLYIIQRQLTAVGEHWIDLPGNHWEMIIVTCIKYVTIVQDKIECILGALKFASIPWSDTMKNLAEEGLMLNHPSATEIKRLEKFVQKKIVLKKYNFETDYFYHQHSSYFLIRRIIHEFREDMLKDALIVADDSSELCVDAYTLCLHQYILHEEYDLISFLFETTDQEILEKCCGRLLCRMEVETDLIILYNYINTINSFSHKFAHITSIKDDLEDLRNLHHLKLNFGIALTLQDYRCKEKRQKAFFSQIKLLVANVSKCDNDILLICKNANYLAQLCRFPSGDGALKVIEYLQHNQLEDAVNANFVPHSRDIIQSVSRELLLNITSTTSNEYQKCRIMSYLFLHHNLSIKDPWLQILPWINHAYGLSRASFLNRSEHVNDAQLLNVFQDSPNTVCTPTVLEFIHLIFSFLGHTEVSVDDILLQLNNLFDILFMEHNFVNLIVLLNITKSCLFMMNVENCNSIDNYMKSVMEKLLFKTITSQNFDISFAVGILFSLDVTTAHRWLHETEQEFRNRFPKLERIAKLGMLYSRKYRLEELAQYTYIYKECLWARYLRKKKICDKLLHEKTNIIMQLVHQDDIIMAKTFCRMFDIDFQFHLPLCLENEILSWEPDFEVKVNTEGQHILTLKNNEDDLVKKCLVIAERMDQSTVKECLEKIQKKVNYYYYEVYICLYVLKKRILQDSSPPQLLLHYLRSYQRTSSVQTEEKRMWLTINQSSVDIPTIAEWRLPYWPHNMWRAVRFELTLNTYDQWLQIADTFNVSEDIIRLFALKQVVNTFKLSESSPTDADWCTFSLDKKIIVQIQKCVSELTSAENACAVLCHVFKLTKRGIAKAQLAKLCYEVTKKWAVSVNTDYAMNILENINRMYLELSTTKILYAYKLVMPNFFNKVLKPELLIRELYYHPDIVKRSTSTESNCPDINTAVTEIAEIHVSVKLQDLLLKLLEEWLTPVYTISDKFDDSISIAGNIQSLKNSQQNEEENFLRASYILKRNDSNTLLRELLDIILGDAKEENVKFKHNAMICIMNTLSMEEISSLCGKSSASLRCHLQVLQFISELESLGYVMTILQFENCKKSHLVTELIGNSKQNCSVLSLAARLAVTYKIFDGEMWTELLKYMIQWNLTEDLEYVLGHLPSATPGVIEAWTHILFIPFQSCVMPVSDEQSKSCLHSLELLHVCPVSCNIDLCQLGQMCCQLNSPHWAAMILPFMCRNSQEVLKKNIFSQWTFNDILLKLESHEDDIIYTQIRAILEEA